MVMRTVQRESGHYNRLRVVCVPMRNRAIQPGHYDALQIRPSQVNLL